MDKELRLEEGYLDDHLRPLKIDGEKTSLEISKSGARISGGLEVVGNGKPIVAYPLITNAITPTDGLIIKTAEASLVEEGGSDYFRNISVDIDIENTEPGYYNGVEIELDKYGASEGNNFTTGLKIGATSSYAIDGTNYVWGIQATGRSQMYEDDGVGISIGGKFSAIGSSNGNSIATGVDINVSGADQNNGLYIKCEDGGDDLKIVSSADTSDYFQIEVGASGASTITLNDSDNLDAADLTFAIDGDTIIDRNVALTTAGTYTGLSIDFDKTGASTSDNTLYGLNIDIDNTTATNGTNTMYGIYCAPTLTHAADAGTVTTIGGYFKAQCHTNGTTKNIGVQIEQVPISDNSLGLQITSSADTADFFSISTGASGATTIATVDDGAAIGHLNIEADGHVEFDNCAVGFDLVTPTYDATNTVVDFKTGNKQFVTFDSGNITNLVLQFPLTSGNFIVLIKQDGTGSRTITNYKAAEFDESAADGVSTVLFPGGSNPTLTTDANHVDIISIFWDADNEIAYGVATLDFQF